MTTSTVPSRHHLRRPDSASLPTAIWSDWSCLVRVVVSEEKVLPAAVRDVESMMARVGRAASRFDPNSELNWVNANPGRPIAVSRTFCNLLHTALTEARRSDGRLDPLLGRDLARLGYDRDIHLVIDDESAPQPRAGRPRWQDISLDRERGLVTVPPNGGLDLGASAKAQTADWAAADLHDRYGVDVMVEIGGDLAVAGERHDWQVTVAEKAGQRGQQVTLGGGGMTTSTTTIRRWARAGEELSHIVDPATGGSVTGRWRSATVAAGSAVHANTCSTTALVLADSALGWLAHQGVAARLVDRQGVVVTIGGWPW